MWNPRMYNSCTWAINGLQPTIKGNDRNPAMRWARRTGNSFRRYFADRWKIKILCNLMNPSIKSNVMWSSYQHMAFAIGTIARVQKSGRREANRLLQRQIIFQHEIGGAFNFLIRFQHKIIPLPQPRRLQGRWTGRIQGHIWHSCQKDLEDVPMKTFDIMVFERVLQF